MTTRRQHYVWRHYLKAWQAPDGFVSSLRDEKLFRANPLNVMVETDFYRLDVITPRDVAALSVLLLRQETSESLRRLHEKLIAHFRLVWYVYESVQNHPNASSDDKARARDEAIQIEERIHAGIEADAVPVLRTLRNKDSSVIHSDETAITFFNFISQQYMRTKTMRDRIEDVLSEFVSPDTAQRIRHLYCHCIATNIGGSLYVDRKKFELVFVDTPRKRGLITGDQPLVNLLSTDDGTAPPEIALYYPLSPILGMILAPKDLAVAQRFAGEEASRIVYLNGLIARKSEHFLVADSASALEPYIAQGGGHRGS